MKVILARDSYGIRPTFYFHDKTSKVLGVCSEVKGKHPAMFRLDNDVPYVSTVKIQPFDH